MKEFGSDFHLCDSNFRVDFNQLDMIGDTRFYACGRHAIEAIIKQEKWKRIWMPTYFCYEVIGYIRSTGIEVMLYDDYPLNENDDIIVRSLPFQEGDVLFRTDYFGLRKRRTNKDIRISVIEDHTHGLTSDWTIKSDADWCIASLRKTLPLAAGGMLWSPKGKKLPDAIKPTAECKEMAIERYEAMNMKAKYLKTAYLTDEEDTKAKNDFREKFVDSEERIDHMKLSGIDVQSKEIANSLNIKQWTDLKIENWFLAIQLLSKKYHVLGNGRSDKWQPFSLVLLLDSASEREALRHYLVGQKIYPAVLWRLPDNCAFKQAKDFSERMLSIHCDIRYSRADITDMCNKINNFYDANF